MRTLSIVIPVYNEKGTLRRLIEAVEKSPVALEKEIIIIDDCSTDGTRHLLESLRRTSNHKIIFHEKNRGKGAALAAGFREARGDVILTQDADLEYNPAEFPSLVEPILSGRADVVYGSRFARRMPGSGIMPSHYWGNFFLTKISNFFTGLSLSDMETGYKAFSRPALEKIMPELVSERFGIEPELTARIAKHKLRLEEVPISYFARGKKEGKKIRWRDGFPALGAILRFNLFD